VSEEADHCCQVLYERGRISEKTQTVVSCNLSSAYKDALRPGVEFWDSGKTLKYLSESEYFIDEADREKGLQWPPALKVVLSDGVYMWTLAEFSVAFQPNVVTLRLIL